MVGYNVESALSRWVLNLEFLVLCPSANVDQLYVSKV
jgi:hypothetical protein